MGRFLLIFILMLIFNSIFAQNSPAVLESRKFRSNQAQFAWGESAFSPEISTRNVDAVYYDLNLEYIVNPEFIQKAVIDEYFRCTQDSLTEFSIDFASFQNGNKTWDSLKVGGDASQYTQQNDVLTVFLNRPFFKNEMIHIRVQFQGMPGGGGFLGFNYDPDFKGHPMISTLSEPYYAHFWWPCLDDPSDKADSATIRVTVPKNFKVASNGTLDSIIDIDANRWKWVWKERYPIAPYLISLAISEYSLISDIWQKDTINMPLMYFVYPEDSVTAQSSFALLPEMLTAFSERFGIYPFYKEKYGHAYFNWGGAMEHQTMTSIGKVSPGWEYVYAHELGHHWFGDLITCENWHEIWMNEGFASYTEAVWAEWKYGREAYMNYFKNTLNSMENWALRKIYVDDLSNVWDIFHRTVYTKGMWVLHMLRYELGDSLFFDVLQKYVKEPQFRFGVTSTQLFNQFVNQLSGKNLNRFFNQWIYYEGYPIVEWDFEQLNDSLEFIFVQNQDKSFNQSTLYEIKLPIQILTDSGTIQMSVRIEPGESTTIKIPFQGNINQLFVNEPLWVLGQFSYNDSLLKKPVTPPPAETGEAFAVKSFYPNPTMSDINLSVQIFKTGRLNFKLVNILGQKVDEKSINLNSPNQEFIFSLNSLFDNYHSLVPGIYLLRIELLNQSKILKIVKLN